MVLSTLQGVDLNYYKMTAIGYVLYSAFEFYLNRRQISKLKRNEMPGNIDLIKDIWDVKEEDIKKSNDYAREKMQNNSWKNLIGSALEIYFMFFGGMQHLWTFSKSISGAYLPQGLMYQIYVFSFLKSSLLGNLVSVPFAYYKDFTIEAKYGFNKTTLATFVSDQIKNTVLGLVLEAPIYAAMIWIIKNGGKNFFWYLWMFGNAMIILFMIIWPNYIAPIYNKFEPLGQGEEADEKEKDLRERVERIAGQLSFPLSEIYKMDGSTRSHHSQAYFFGIFNKKRIVIYDTLIDQCDNLETEAVLFHELGHWYFSHNVQMLMMTFMQFFAISFWINSLIFKDEIYSDFGIEKDMFLGLNLTIFTIEPLLGTLMKGIVAIVRKNEFQADKFAYENGYAEPMVKSLVKIYKENKANLNPDWMYSMFNHTHPTLLQRVAAIKGYQKREE